MEADDLLSVVGPKDIDFRPSGMKLQERWKGERHTYHSRGGQKIKTGRVYSFFNFDNLKSNSKYVWQFKCFDSSSNTVLLME